MISPRLRLALFSLLYFLSIGTGLAGAAGTFDISGLHPGLTLDAVKKMPAPGADKYEKRRVVCLDEQDVVSNMVSVLESDAAHEEAAGILTCLVAEPDTMNPDYWAPSVVEVEGAKVRIWLPFVVQESGSPKLAMIMLKPFAKGDEKKMNTFLTKELGVPQQGQRKFTAAVSSDKPTKVSKWTSANGDIDAVETGEIYYYNLALAQELQSRVSKIPGKSFFYAVPETDAPASN